MTRGRSKLDDRQLAEVRKLLREGVPQRIIARHYGVSQAHVAAINKRMKEEG